MSVAPLLEITEVSKSGKVLASWDLNVFERTV